MTGLITLLWLLGAIILSTNTIRARRSSSGIRNSGLRSPGRLGSWAPQQTRAADPWPPTSIIIDRQTQQRQGFWIPQQIANNGQYQDWAPIEIEQTQHTIPWRDQTQQRDDCIFNYDNVGRGHIYPFLVDYNRKEFVYPDVVYGQQRVTIANGTTLIVACPRNQNHLLNTNKKYIYITCRNSQLYHGKKPVYWVDLRCQKKLKSTLKAGKKCGQDSRTYHIGWAIRRRLFIPQITVCFNTNQETTMYTAHTIHGRFIDAKVVDSSRPSFKSRNMFSVSIDTGYRQAKQNELAKEFLDTTKLDLSNTRNYLARGHLTPDADFVLEAEQDATYYYANAVPQWQSVNNGNWKRLEFAIRALAEERQATLKVYTGTYGVLELPDQRDHQPVKMFLGLSFGKKVVPVPALMWKVVYDPASHNAVAFTILNDITQNAADAWTRPPCTSVCSRIPWIDWDVNHIRKGITLCCQVEDLRHTIPYIPVIESEGLLV